MVIDIILILLIVFGVLSGFKKGLVRTLVSFACLIISVILAFMLKTPITNMLVQTKMAENVNAKITETLQNNLEVYVKKDSGKENFYDNIMNSLNGGESVDIVAGEVTRAIFSIVSFITIFIISLIIGYIIKMILNVVFDLPLLSSVNKLGGGALGLISVLVKIYIVFTIIALLSPIDIIKPVDEAVREGKVSGYLYENNMILNTIKKSF